MTNAEIKTKWFELANAAIEEVPQTCTYQTPLCDRVRKGYEWLKNNLSLDEFEEVEQFTNDYEMELTGIIFAVEQKKESKLARMHAEYCEAMNIRYDAARRTYIKY